MSSEEKPDDKPFDPTPKKLEDARQKGDIVRSTDLNTIVIYLSSLLIFFVCGNLLFFEFFNFNVDLIRRSAFIAMPSSVHGSFNYNVDVTGALLFVTSIFFIPFLVLLLFLLFQRGIVFKIDKISPKIENIAIVKNAKQKWGAKGIFEFLKSLFKSAMVIGLLAILWYREIDWLLTTVHWEYQHTAKLIFVAVLTGIILGLLVAVPVGILDFVQKHLEHLKENRMSHKEMKDEAKEAEGDPYLKQKRRQFGYELTDQAKMLQDVAGATVIVVNPSHYAVALMWDGSRDRLPVCVAKGTDSLAIQIKRIAKENCVPIYRDPPSARLLYSALGVGASIKERHFRIVASAIKFAERLRSSQREIHDG